jgi:hypothetical protein
LDVHLHLPQESLTNPAGLRTADLRRAMVTLPQGVSLNTSLADGLASCTEAQVGYDPDERQVVDVEASGGPVRLEFEGELTPELPDFADAAEVAAALTALPDVQEGDVAVSGRRGGPWTVDFAGSLAGKDVPPISGTHSEVQRLALAGVPHSVVYAPVIPAKAGAFTSLAVRA